MRSTSLVRHTPRAAVKTLALLLGALAATGASAANIDQALSFSTAASGDWTAQVLGGHPKADGSFIDRYYFSLPASAAGSVLSAHAEVFIPSPATTAHFDLQSLSMSLWLDADQSGSLTGGDLLSQAFGSGRTIDGSIALAQGAYFLEVSGTVSSTARVGGAYMLNLSMPVAAVPEPGQYAMLLAGLGLVALISHRRR
ncbi:FxDxF family PEP-CTERM protein [Denitromonas iodatirespirans]|uniref:FxDxF family PEP-CTERM protein n=1 Tax=Denitromonas iodatirespirans TaxID=2795389 RepID=A0A944H9T3_DENI1|nr:FxDxF family PEP-CTERM protein [Denitromonas iodatirespirans]MBT0959857.1 FxDxF family PEP-CTERM protein [Denitromonas iodatirespirans]